LPLSAGCRQLISRDESRTVSRHPLTPLNTPQLPGDEIPHNRMKPCVTLLSLQLLGLQLPAEPTCTQFKNGEIGENVRWLDSQSNLINAHDGGIIFFDGIYYWYGMVLRSLGLGREGANGAATTTGVVLYSSKDLYNWTYEKVILPCSAELSDPLLGPMRFERPKILYNDKTRKFVIWFHYVRYPGDHGDGVGQADAGVATADSIKGPFTFLGYHRPIDPKGAVKDCTLFKDTDGSAYFIYDRKVASGRCLHVVKLTDDYLHSSPVWAKIAAAENREAPAVLRHNGYYFLFTSGVTGWTPNPAKYYRATNVMGPYTDMGEPCVGSDKDTTYNSQPTYIFPVENRTDAFIIMLERHNITNFARCSYIWLPVLFPTQSTVEVKYYATWDLDAFAPATATTRLGR
jgi:hypothetical protein